MEFLAVLAYLFCLRLKLVTVVVFGSLRRKAMLLPVTLLTTLVRMGRKGGTFLLLSHHRFYHHV